MVLGNYRKVLHELYSARKDHKQQEIEREKSMDKKKLYQHVPVDNDNYKFDLDVSDNDDIKSSLIDPKGGYTPQQIKQSMNFANYMNQKKIYDDDEAQDNFSRKLSFEASQSFLVDGNTGARPIELGEDILTEIDFEDMLQDDAERHFLKNRKILETDVGFSHKNTGKSRRSQKRRIGHRKDNKD